MQHASVRGEHHWKDRMGQLSETSASQPNRAFKSYCPVTLSLNVKCCPGRTTATAYPVQVHPESNLGRV